MTDTINKTWPERIYLQACDDEGDELPKFCPHYEVTWCQNQQHATDVEYVRADLIAEFQQDAAKYRAINTPEIADFLSAIENEALHQRERWGSQHDAGKTDADWFWLVGYLAGKAIRPDASPEKQLHHIITSAAVLLNWHSAKIGAQNDMRAGIGPDKQPPKPTAPSVANSREVKP